MLDILLQQPCNSFVGKYLNLILPAWILQNNFLLTHENYQHYQILYSDIK